MLALFLLPLLLAAHNARADAGSTDGGMVNWPREEMTRALDIVIEQRMEKLGVPGLAIAIVTEDGIVFEKGYGVADVEGDVPVTAHTLFEAASLGKPVAAYGALLLAKERKLALDAPLGRDLPEPWLGDEDDHAQVTLRQVLNHTSGLSNRLRLSRRTTSFEPGSRFSYSGVGYMYLAHVMATVEEMPFDRWMRDHVFAPLGMNSSGYTVPDALVDTVARGHHPLWLPIVAYAGPALGFFVLLAVVTVAIVRFGLGRLRVEPVELLPALVLSPLLAAGLLFFLEGAWALVFALSYFLVWLGGIFVVAIVLQYLWFILDQSRGEGVLSRGATRRGQLNLSMLAIAFGASLVFMPWQVPGPARDGDALNAASSLRSSAHDLGMFIKGFIDGEVIGPGLRARMVDSRVEIGGDAHNIYGWGLGFGTRETLTSLTVWQWGSNVGSQSLMVIDPARRVGVVVLTNANSGAELVQEVAGHVLGEADPWELP